MRPANRGTRVVQLAFQCRALLRCCKTATRRTWAVAESARAARAACCLRHTVSAPFVAALSRDAPAAVRNWSLPTAVEGFREVDVMIVTPRGTAARPLGALLSACAACSVDGVAQ